MRLGTRQRCPFIRRNTTVLNKKNKKTKTKNKKQNKKTKKQKATLCIPVSHAIK